MEVNSLIGEHICYMHSMHNYILLYMYVGRSQEVDEINMHHIQYMYLTLCYQVEPACKFRKKLIFFLNSLPQFFISKLTFLSTNITLSILSILAVYGMRVICTSYQTLLTVESLWLSGRVSFLKITMLACRVVCCSHQSHCRIWVCISH